MIFLGGGIYDHGFLFPHCLILCNVLCQGHKLLLEQSLQVPYHEVNLSLYSRSSLLIQG